MTNGLTTPLQKEVYLSPKLAVDVDGHLTNIILAHIISSNFEMRQSTGDFLGNFMPLMLNDTLFDGFSWYSEEECHESKHGNGTCSYLLARDSECIKIGRLLATLLLT